MQRLNDSDSAPVWVITIGAMVFLSLVVIFAVVTALGLAYLFRGGVWLLRGLRKCDDCGWKFCPVEMHHDLELNHRGNS
jgi:hypothetical protein